MKKLNPTKLTTQDQSDLNQHRKTQKYKLKPIPTAAAIIQMKDIVHLINKHAILQSQHSTL